MAVLIKINNTLQSVGALRKVSNTLNRTNIDLYKKEGISDLTGTSWEFNDTIILGDFSYGISFYCQGYDSRVYNSLISSPGGTVFPSVPAHLTYVWGADNDETVFMGGWYDEYYRYIVITGGDDVTNPDLIAWLQENATQITQ